MSYKEYDKNPSSFKIKNIYKKHWGHVGPLHTIQGYQGTEMSGNADLITMETYVQQGKQFENQFFIYESKC